MTDDNNAITEWRFPPQHPILPRGQIHIWHSSLERSASEMQVLAQFLSTDEQARAERYCFEKARHQFVVSRGLLRYILGRYLDIQPARLQFCYGNRGKPTLASGFDGNTIKFNLSHSQGMVLYALTYNSPIGIDLEYISPFPDVEQIIERFFSFKERSVFRTLPPSLKDIAFFYGWTRKEAYLKAVGQGLAQPLHQIEVSLTPGEPACLISISDDPEEAARWSIYSFQPGPDYAAAIVTEGHEWHLKYWQGNQLEMP